MPLRLLTLLVTLLHVYTGLRLLPALAPFTGAWPLLLAALLLSAATMPLPFIGARAGARRGGPAHGWKWLGLLSMGWFSSIFVLTLVRDAGLLLAWALAGVGGVSIDSPTAQSWSAAAVALVSTLVTLIGFFNARRTASVVRVDVPIRGLPASLEGFTIAQLSDIHVGPTIRRGYLQRIVDAVNRLGADMVAITGDLVDGTVSELREHVAPLAGLRARHGTFVVTGNHEYYGSDIAERTGTFHENIRNNVSLLNNTAIEYKGHRFLFSTLWSKINPALEFVIQKSMADFRLIIGEIGGGFGMKTGVANEDVLVCYAARKLARPVKWRAERAEEFLAAHMGRDQHYDGELALDREGRILALRVTTHANFGATPVGSTAIIPLLLAPKVQTTVYHVPAVDYRVYGLLTNTMATGAYRGAGRPEANYLMERLIEQAAREMKLDSAEIRRRNFIRPDQFPYKTHVDDWYDAGEFARVLDRALAAADWNGFAARRKASQLRGRLRGRGLACYLEWTGAPIRTETVDIQVDADGTVSVYTGTQAMGQGLETTYTQLITEVLQIPAKTIRVVQGDTDAATGVGSVGSRSAFVGGSAAVAAGKRAIVRGKELAADALESSVADIEYAGGRFSIAGTDRSLALAEVAARAPEGRIRVSATETPSTPSWPNGAQVCELEIDPDTGEIELASMTSVDDIGRIINHMIVEGQVHGGIAQGLGQALFEQAVYDPASGQLLTGSLMDYCVPRADQMPPMNSAFDESVPCKTNLLGVKGCGEIGTIGAVPAAMHAALDALSGHGVTHLEMPLTPERIWRALRGQTA